jgi:signal transduction histidine kinase
MPERPRVHAEGGARRRALAAWVAVLALALPTFPAAAQTGSRPSAVLAPLLAVERHELVSLALTLGVLVFALAVSIALVRTRARAARELEHARNEAASLRDELERANALLRAEPQAILVWRDAAADPDVIGDAAAVTGATSRLLAFGTWLVPQAASDLEHALDALRRRGEAFRLVLRTRTGLQVEADGRPIAGAAVLRLHELSGDRRRQAALSERAAELEQEVARVRGVLSALPAPVWLRNAEGALTFVNRAYAAAVEARDAEDAIARGLELLERGAREEAARARAAGRMFAGRVPAIFAGTRHMLDVVEVSGPGGAAGIGLDATEVEKARTELARIVDAHRRTLDQLATAVAIFGADHRLVFHNAAYQKLFQLEPAFLDERPTDSAVLERLRAERRLPEEADFRAWEAQLHEAYRAVEPREQRWYVPGGRILRVVTSPNADGGVTYLFDDITERMELESRFNALNRTQSETLDALADAVAVFGSDGRLKLFNPAFARTWKLSPQSLASRPHIEMVIGWCRPLLPRRPASEDALEVLKAAITRLDARAPVGQRIERVDGSVLDAAAMPLPDGGTLVTFRDVSDSVNVERALRERNEALVAADALKSAFVQHVSYELRSPLTTIIGFAQLLDDPAIGPLNAKQREYVGHITESSAALLAIINDILDLASIDAGAMQLDVGDVDVRETMEAAAEGVRDRLPEHDLKLDIRVRPDIGKFRGDARRVRQILFNLLSNAIGFSPPGETVTLSAERRDGAVIFRVADKGPGIPPELKERIFERFETHARGTRHRGTGLGLAIVRSFMALHGGSVTIDTAPGGGTVVACIFPPSVAADTKAAE